MANRFTWCLANEYSGEPSPRIVVGVNPACVKRVEILPISSGNGRVYRATLYTDGWYGITITRASREEVVAAVMDMLGEDPSLLPQGMIEWAESEPTRSDRD